MSEIEVTIFRRNRSKVWQMQYRDPVSGRKMQRSTGKTKRTDAIKAAGRWQAEVRQGKASHGGMMAWADFREKYEREKASGLADRTQDKINQVLNLVETILNPRRLRDMDRAAINQFETKLRNDRGQSDTSIKSTLAHLRAALNWAVENELLGTCPRFPKIHRAKSSKVMRGRPISGEEFERVLAALPQVITKPNLGRSRKPSGPDHDRIPAWEFLLRGLWCSGLRISEALSLHWTDEQFLTVDMTMRHPMLRIPAEREKGHKDRLLPMAPEFAELLLDVPERRRVGFVFDPRPQRPEAGRLSAQQVTRKISEAGRAANVVVDRKGDKVKYATAHDLRRSFGERWASRVMPQVLMELMRHETIDTTLKFYVGRNAMKTAGVLWEVHQNQADSGLGGTLGGTPRQEPELEAEKPRKPR